MTPLEIVGLWEKLELELTSSLRRNLARHKAQEARRGRAERHTGALGSLAGC